MRKSENTMLYLDRKIKMKEEMSPQADGFLGPAFVEPRYDAVGAGGINFSEKACQ